ncbi:hypothetical protein BCON_0083g00420 [Botryotinia convoluta]|uniref:Uncharacterized protein n=1 Tax=Botryotinia convoluta TaxID=54673 RepID=A0A4Z1I316_9HELO|nr:hypothetical protein BCON_0083g00420 [Botryotinia convoluta]
MNTKITLLGERNVGKTSMASRILQLDYLSIGSHPLYENIQEISTTDHLDELLKKSLGWAECLVMIYNIGSQRSFDIGAELFAHALKYRSPRVAIAVANVDGANERVVDREQFVKFVNGYKGFNVGFLETSIRESQKVFQSPIEPRLFSDQHYPFMKVVQRDGRVVDAEVTTQRSPDSNVINVETSLSCQILPMPMGTFDTQSVHISAEVLAEEYALGDAQEGADEDVCSVTTHPMSIPLREKSMTNISSDSMIDTVKPPTEQGWVNSLLETFVRECVDSNWHCSVESGIDEKCMEAPTMEREVDEDLAKPQTAPRAFQIICYDYIEDLREAKEPRSKVSPESRVEVSTDMQELKSGMLSNTQSYSERESYVSEETILENIGGNLGVKLGWLRYLCCL